MSALVKIDWIVAAHLPDTVEVYAKAGKRPPLARGYRIKINGEPYVIREAMPTGMRGKQNVPQR